MIPTVKERIIIYDKWGNLNDNTKLDVFSQVDKVLAKRMNLWQRYSRGIDFMNTGRVHYEEASQMNDQSMDNNHLQIMLEKFIVDIAAGYLSGTVEYDTDSTDDIQSKVKKIIFDTEPITPEQAQELKYVIDTISRNNSDVTELTTLFRDVLLYGSCYERIIDDTKEGYRYYSLEIYYINKR